MHYNKIRKIPPNEQNNHADYTPPYGWVILGIEQIRQWHHEQAFADETTYIIAEKAAEE